MKNYIDFVKALESNDYDGIRSRLNEDELIRLNHAAYGLTGESAEFADQVKKHVYYGKPLDKVNLKEELGDILFFVALASDVLGTNFEELMSINTAKLSARYKGGKFSANEALNRNLEVERKILEK